MRLLLKFAAGFIVLLLAYLSVAGLWAAAANDEIATQYPPLRQPLLADSQTAILLAVEDPTYFSHSGLDLSRGQGLTTITSSAARELYLNRLQLTGVAHALQRFYRQVFACCKRVDIGRDVFALVLNRQLAKDDLLNLFATTIYMGRVDGQAVWGLPQAANAYFGKPLAELEQKQFVTLVAMLQSPNQFHPINNPRALADRVGRIQRLLRGQCKAQGLLDTDYPDCASAVN